MILGEQGMGISAEGVWVTEEHLNRLVDHWFKRAVGENIQFDDFDRFVSLWIAFNAWGTAKLDSNLITSFRNLIGTDQSFLNEVKMLKDLCPVTRGKHYRRSDSATISDVNNFPEVLEVIYVIRNNLFHGEKLDDPRDRALVLHAFGILSKLFEKVKSR